MKAPVSVALMMCGDRGWTGGVEYTRNLVLALGGLPADERKSFKLSLIVNEELEEELFRELSPCLDKIYVTRSSLPPLTLRNMVRWLILKFLLKIDRPRFYDFLRQEHFDFIYPFFSATSRRTPFSCATWIADFQHKYLPQCFTEAEIASRDADFARRANLAKTMVLSSLSAEKDYQKFYPDAAARSRVLPFRTTPGDTWFKLNPIETQNAYKLPDRYFIVCNQFWQHKNHITVFEALKILKHRGVEPIVVFTGHIYDHRQPYFSDYILSNIQKLGISDQVKLLGLIPRTDQVQLMRRSMAVIQPSLFEGWSTVVEDARVLGKRIALSNLSVHKEQNPPHARFFEKESPEELAQVVEGWWETLSAGPDVEQEKLARARNVNEREEFAKDFLKIARGE